MTESGRFSAGNTPANHSTFLKMGSVVRCIPKKTTAIALSLSCLSPTLMNQLRYKGINPVRDGVARILHADAVVGVVVHHSELDHGAALRLRRPAINRQWVRRRQGCGGGRGAAAEGMWW